MQQPNHRTPPVWSTGFMEVIHVSGIDFFFIRHSSG